MARGSALDRRTARSWAIRGALALGAAWLGYGAVSHSLASAIRLRATERAHALAPGNGRITALTAVRLLQPDADAKDYDRAEAMARTALRQDASAVDAVAALGLIAQGRGDTAASRRLFAYSDHLSRRDLRTRLGMIEDAVARNDVAGALHSYDIALRTSRLAGSILFPVLSAAIAERPVRDNLVHTLAARPPWGDSFIFHVTAHGPDPSISVKLLHAVRLRGITISPDASAIIINRLLGQGRAAAAWTYYASSTPGADIRRSRDPHFARMPAVPSVFDWQTIEDSGISSSIERDGDGGVFDFSVASSVAGPVLRQTQMLPAGDYVIEGISTGIDRSDRSLPYWSLQCLSGREIGRVAVSQSLQNGGRFAGRVTVPTDCPVQQLTLIVRSSDNVGGATGQIRQVAVRPVQEGAK